MQTILRLTLPLVCTGIALASAAAAPGLPNPFFAMDTATRDAAHQTPEAQVKLVQALGYAGLGWHAREVPEVRAALDREGLKLFAAYIGAEVDGTNRQAPPALVKLVEELRGSGAAVWLFLTSKKYQPSDPVGDEPAVALIRDLAERARPAGVSVSLYPHTGFWMERVQDAVRLAQKAGRTNVGVTFNLCHCLKVGDEPRIPDLLELARPHLTLVTLNGADHQGDWDRLIQPLDRGAFDLVPLLKKLRALDYTGPIGFQGYGIKGDARETLRRTLDAWKRLSARAAE